MAAETAPGQAPVPSEAVTLHGGCHCNAIQYTVRIPEASARPTWTRESSHPVPPIRSIDHCESCRGAVGNLFQTWFIVPRLWVEWSLRVRKEGAQGIKGEKSQAEKEEEHEERVTLDGKTAPFPSPKTASTYLSYYNSSDKIWRSFCSNCGTSIAYCVERSAAEEENEIQNCRVDLTLGSFRKEDLDKEWMAPTVQAWQAEGIPWVKNIVTLKS